MAKPKVYTFRTLYRTLRKHDKRFYWKPAGRGSHRAICHDDIRGMKRHVIVPCHSEGDDLRPYVIQECIHNFELPAGTL